MDRPTEMIYLDRTDRKPEKFCRQQADQSSIVNVEDQSPADAESEEKNFGGSFGRK